MAGSIIYEVGLKIDTDKSGKVDILRGLLLDMGFVLSDIAESRSFPYTALTVYFRSAQKARSLRTMMKGYHLKDVKFEIKRLKKSDWQTKWKTAFKPFQLTKHFKVVPIRYRNKHISKPGIPICLDTDMAFGTGLHPTTRYMAGFVDRYAGRCRSFLDIGTGTGILAILASKCGVPDVEAVDISHDAVRVARKNFGRNGCSSIKIRMENGHRLRRSKKYDFVCANIITQDLIAMAPRLISLVKKGGYLSVSGISISGYTTFRGSYKKYPLRCIKIEKGEGWTAILFKKTDRKRS